MPGERSRHVLIIPTIALAIFMTNLDTSIVNIALPTLAKTFNADTDSLSHVILFSPPIKKRFVLQTAF
ncbi:MAG: hypothetical protein PHR81_07820 [Bacteroidales bacterium]|jgi:MFS family permease|nr:hypothetical protein [Bacteroidales bacterium]MDD4214702.1 hypothetical protein [Bacteroidales bacterium]